MRINELKDKVTDYDVDDLHLLVDTSYDEQESNRSYSNMSDDMSLSISIPKHPNLQRTGKRRERPVTKPIPAEFITFASKLFNELKDRLIDIAETGSAPNSQSDLIVRRSKNKSKIALQLSRSEQAELKKVGQIYDDVLRDSSDMRLAAALIGDDVDTRSSEGDFIVSSSLLRNRVDKVNPLSFATSTPNWNALEASIAENYARNFPGPKMDGDVEDDNMMAYDVLRDSRDMNVAAALIGDDDGARSSEGDFIVSSSLLRNRVDKVNPLSFATSTPNWNVLEASIAENYERNFPGTQMDGDVEDENMMAYLESTDDESMFYIMKDSEEGTFTDIEMDNAEAEIPKTNRMISNQLKIQQLEKDLGLANTFQKKFVKIGTTTSQNYSNRFFEKVVRPDVFERDNKSAGDNVNIVPNLTDTRRSDAFKVQDRDVMENKRLIFTKNRQHIALNRKELLSNIARAQAALQTLDDSDSSDVDKTSQSFRAESLKVHSPLRVHSPPRAHSPLKVHSPLRVHSPPRAHSPLKVHSPLNVYPPLKVHPPPLLTPFGESSYMQIHTEGTIPIRNSQTNQNNKENMNKLDDPDPIPIHLHPHVHEPPMSKVLVFDQLNPLNNILIRPNFTMNSEYNRNNNNYYNQACRLGTTKDFEVRTMTVQQNQFMPRSAQEADQGIKHFTSYAVEAKELAVDAESTNLSEDSLLNKFSSNNCSIITQTKDQVCKNKLYNSGYVSPKLHKKSFHKRKKELTSIDKKKGSPAPAKQEKRNPNPNTRKSKVRDKKSSKTKMTKPGRNITVRQLIADCIGLDSGTKHNIDVKEKIFDENFNANSQNAMYSPSKLSFTSSKNLNPMKDFLSPPYEDCLTLHRPTIQSMIFQEEFQPKPYASKVVVFDYLNSLNNVLISPFNATKVHRHYPKKPDKTVYCPKQSSSNENYYNQTTRDDIMRPETCAQYPTVPKVSFTEKDNEIITSKLNLVNTEKQATVINDTINTLPNITSHDPFSSNTPKKATKVRKRTYSPLKGKHRLQGFAQVTPKNITKRQKISTSPKTSRKVGVKERVKLSSNNVDDVEPQKDGKETNVKKTHTSKPRVYKLVTNTMTKPERNITVQRVIAEHPGFDTGYRLEDYNKNLTPNIAYKSFTEFSQSDITFSKKINPKEIVSNLKIDCQSPLQYAVPVTPNQMGWPPELMAIKNEADPGANVVARIDMLPFMGSHECEWETSLADIWSFRLLHGQLRLMARLAHRLDNATRTLVRGDTPILDITVKIVRQDRMDLEAQMCLSFASEAMSHIVERVLRTRCNASDIPPLLQRCANVVRVALRWKRAMYDAKQRLAYTLDNNGNLSLKVANISLRSVWEVTMHIGLVIDSDSLVPCPHASHVRVLPVVSDVPVPIVDVRRTVKRTPKDWGHVPGTIWRVYRLLKYKKRDDTLRDDTLIR
ncbi:hypothetical protein PYW08_012582 [Mythimna loreyi]|uniref:Uncharacterized protein n=1 Tax=Mythimna loreyi TaxID=667449 RepID=A0ACC2Q1V2_9NEOP|nr:hypothetical protein PYW08_012582 [Mythimna loreyi]